MFFFKIPHYTKTRKHIGARKTWQITCLGARSLPHGRYIPTPGLSRSNLLINELWSPKLSVQSQLGGKTCRWFVFLVCIQRQTCAFLVLARLQRVFEDNFFCLCRGPKSSQRVNWLLFILWIIYIFLVYFFILKSNTINTCKIKNYV